MQSSEFIQLATKTENRDFPAIRDRLTDRNIRLLHGAIGVATEAGELLDAIKKALFYGRELDVTNFIEETFDLMWYQAIICHELGIDFEVGMVKIIDKLRARYGNAFSEERAVNRNLEAERQILEK